MHGGDATERVEVVHHGEESLLHLTAVPCVDDHLFALLDVECNHGFGMESEFLVFLAFCLGCVEDHEVGLEVLKFLLGGADEHIGHEMGLPCHFHDEAHVETRCLVGAAIAVNDIKSLVGKLLYGLFFQMVPYLCGDGLVVVLIFVGSPPYGVFRYLVLDKILVFR